MTRVLHLSVGTYLGRKVSKVSKASSLLFWVWPQEPGGSGAQERVRMEDVGRGWTLPSQARARMLLPTNNCVTAWARFPGVVKGNRMMPLGPQTTIFPGNSCVEILY